MSQVAKSSIIVTLFTTFGIVLNFFSNVVIAAKFGTSKEMDIYWAATTIPFFIITIISGSLNFTFIPLFAEYRARKNKELCKIVSSIINLNIIIVTFLCFIGIIFAPTIMKIITPGFDNEKIIKSVEMLRWLLPIIIFNVVNTLMASVYYSNQKFLVPSLNKIISPLLIIIYVSLFHNSLSTKSIVLATLSSSFIQMILLAYGFFNRLNFQYYFTLDYKHPSFLKIVKLMFPLIIGGIVYRAVPIFDRYFLSKLPEGSISYIGYAQKLLSVIPPIISSGISVSIFPIMSKYVAEKKWIELKEIMSRGIRMLLFMSIPFAVILGPFSESIIKIVFERGAFTSADTSAVYNAFYIYLLALPAMTIGTIIGQGYYVLQDTKTPAILGIIESIIYISLCYCLLPSLGYLAIPISYTIYFNLSMYNAFIVRYKMKLRGGIFIVKSFFKYLSTAVILAFVVGIINKIFTCSLLTLFSIILSYLLYLVINKYIFKTEEAIKIWNYIRYFRLRILNSK